MKTLSTYSRASFHFLGVLMFGCFICSCNSSPPNSPQRTTKVKKLAIYYGWPSLLSTSTNSSLTLDRIIDTINQYDLVVFGRNLDLPQTECPCDGYNNSSICTSGGNSGHNFWENPNEPWTNHCDHDKTVEIIDELQTKSKKTLVFGYISIGGENTFRRFGNISIAQPISGPVPLTMSEIEATISRWATMGVDGIFLDEAEYGFGADRDRQNQVIQKVHDTSNKYGQKLRVFINSWNPDDVFSATPVGFVYYPAINVNLSHTDGKVTVEHTLPHGYSDGDQVNIVSPVQAFNGEQIIAESSTNTYTYEVSGTNLPSLVQGTSSKRSNNRMNPNGTETILNENDIFLLEHFQIHFGAYQNYLVLRADKALKYRTIYGTKIAAVTTDVNRKLPDIDQSKLNYAWWSTLLYGFDYFGWGEGNGFSVGETANFLPMRPRPTAGDIGNVYTSPVVHNSNVHRRTTSTTTIELDTDNYNGKVTSAAFWRFEEGAGNEARDETGNENHGTIFNASHSPEVNAFGIESNHYALSFDARSEYVEIPGNPNTNLNSFERGLTLEAYIKPESLPITQDNNGFRVNFILWADDEIYSLLLRSDQSGNTSLVGNINCGLRASGVADISSFGNFLEIEDEVSSKDGIGSNVVMTYGSDRLRLYSDGQIIAEREGNCGNQVGPISTIRDIVRIGNDETARSTFHDRNFKGLIDEVRISSRPLLPAEFLDYNKGLYVWRDPTRGGTPITEENLLELAFFALSENIGTIFYDKFGKGPLGKEEEPDGQEEQAADVLGILIESLHELGLKVEALITTPAQISSVRDVYNPSVSPAQRFDGIRLHEVSFLHDKESPEEVEDLQIYSQAVMNAYPLPLFTTIGNNWDREIFYNGQSKRAFEHIVDITSGVDILTRSDDPNVITEQVSEEICYANAAGKITHLLIETDELPDNLGATFYDEGKIIMKGNLVSLNFQGASCNNSLTGYAFHSYRSAFGDSQW